MMEEIWKGIKGFSRYMVSNLGRVKTKDYIQSPCHCRPNGACIKGKILKTPIDTNGYKIVRLYCDGKNVKAYVHRLVAEAFIPKIQNKNYINHIDSDRTNNNVSNLEWCTPKENVHHCKKNGRAVYYSGSSLPYSILNELKVKEIKRLLNDGVLQKDIANKFGVSTSCIHSIKTGRTWKGIV